MQLFVHTMAVTKKPVGQKTKLHENQLEIIKRKSGLNNGAITPQ